MAFIRVSFPLRTPHKCVVCGLVTVSAEQENGRWFCANAGACLNRCRVAHIRRVDNRVAREVAANKASKEPR